MPETHLDVDALLAALNAHRESKKLSWRKLAAAVGTSPSTFTRMREGKRPDVDSFGALVKWLGVPAEHFLHPTRHASAAKRDQPTMAMIATYLRADKNLTKKSAEALEDIIRAAYESLKTP